MLPRQVYFMIRKGTCTAPRASAGPINVGTLAILKGRTVFKIDTAGRELVCGCPGDMREVLGGGLFGGKHVLNPD